MEWNSCLAGLCFKKSDEDAYSLASYSYPDGLCYHKQKSNKKANGIQEETSKTRYSFLIFNNEVNQDQLWIIEA